MNKKIDKIGILGYGEIGKAIASFYQNPKIKDLDGGDDMKDVDILNICIPYSKHFIKIVKKEIAEIKPNLTIIHSSVAPGTTKKIGGMIVHSPIRGVHPKLREGIKTFLKYIGTDNKKAGKMARKHLKSLGLKTKIFEPSETTEMGKLLSTTYYGLCIAFHGEAQKLCKKYNVSFGKAISDFTRSYNNGYRELGMKDVVRPNLYPPLNNKIGGHCVIQNTKILKKHFRSKIFGTILKYK